MSKRGALHCKCHATGKQKIHNWPLKEMKLALENCSILLKYHQYEESICDSYPVIYFTSAGAAFWGSLLSTDGSVSLDCSNTKVSCLCCGLA